MADWIVDRIIHFGPGDLLKNGLPHFGFHDRQGNHYAIFHQKHFLGLIGGNDRLEWTVAAHPIFEGTPNITAELNYPMYIDNLTDGTLLVSNFGDPRIYRINVGRKKAELFADDAKIGMTDAGNYKSVKSMSNNPEEKDPLKLNLPEISSMDYYDRHLFVPTDLSQKQAIWQYLEEQINNSQRVFLKGNPSLRMMHAQSTRWFWRKSEHQ